VSAPALAFVVLGFAAGAIPFGVIVARRHAGLDIQQHGSGNIGATNVARVLGVVPGVIVLLLDAAKGAVPVAVALRWSGDLRIALATGGAAILGHCFSPVLRFRGGKGVATALGVFAVVTPDLAAGSLLVFGVAYALSRVPALGSLAGAIAITVGVIVRGDQALATFAIATTALLFFTHRSNLAKLR
jgi:acyl phosphate:glycerol-3-phosphate acyltransferase